MAGEVEAARVEDDDQGTPTWISIVARFGYVAKGVVYLLIGFVSTLTVFGPGRHPADSMGAFRELMRQPFGRVLLGIVTIGLFSYAAWRYIQTIFDPDDRGWDFQGLMTRGYVLGSGIIHTGLGITGSRMAIPGGHSGDEGERVEMTARLMAKPYGPWVVGIAGVVTLGVALRQFYRAYRRNFEHRVELDELDEDIATWLVRVCRYGILSRGVVYGIIGLFLIIAAWRVKAAEIKGLAGALQTLREQPYGALLVLLVAVGLGAYGVFQLVKARYREIGAVED